MLLLNGLDHFGQNEFIEIAKGKQEYPSTFKAFIKQIKRELQWRKRK